MALWSNIRRLAFSGAVQGVLDPGPLEVLTPAQAVQIVDDASHAVAPPRVPQVILSARGGPINGAEFSAVEFQARAGGLVLEYIAAEDNSAVLNLRLWRLDAQATTVRAAVTTFSTFGVPAGEQARSGFFDVRVAVIPGNASRLQIGISTHQPLNLYIAPGERLFFSASVVNTRINLFARLREIPLEAR